MLPEPHGAAMLWALRKAQIVGSIAAKPPMHSARLISSLATWNSRGSSADSHQRVILVRPRYALFPAKLGFIPHGGCDLNHILAVQEA
jgi:hypothetical protein